MSLSVTMFFILGGVTNLFIIDIPIYTSYFAKSKEIVSVGLVPISIALQTPAWFNGLSVGILKPSLNIIKQYKTDKNIDSYEKSYHKLLIDRCGDNGNNIPYLIEIIKSSTTDAINRYKNNCRFNGLCFMCYESSEKFCHRHLLAKWLKMQGFTVSEYVNLRQLL